MNGWSYKGFARLLYLEALINTIYHPKSGGVVAFGYPLATQQKKND